MDLGDSRDRIIEAAERLEYQTRLDTVGSLEPWVRHAPGCLQPVCSCGLSDVLVALRRDHRGAASAEDEEPGPWCLAYPHRAGDCGMDPAQCSYAATS